MSHDPTGTVTPSSWREHWPLSTRSAARRARARPGRRPARLAGGWAVRSTASRSTPAPVGPRHGGCKRSPRKRWKPSCAATAAQARGEGRANCSTQPGQHPTPASSARAQATGSAPTGAHRPRSHHRTSRTQLIGRRRMQARVVNTSVGPVEVALTPGVGEVVLCFPGGHTMAATPLCAGLYIELGYPPHRDRRREPLLLARGEEADRLGRDPPLMAD